MLTITHVLVAGAGGLSSCSAAIIVLKPF